MTNSVSDQEKRGTESDNGHKVMRQRTAVTEQQNDLGIYGIGISRERSPNWMVLVKLTNKNAPHSAKRKLRRRRKDSGSLSPLSFGTRFADRRKLKKPTQIADQWARHFRLRRLHLSRKLALSPRFKAKTTADAFEAPAEGRVGGLADADLDSDRNVQRWERSDVISDGAIVDLVTVHPGGDPTKEGLGRWKGVPFIGHEKPKEGTPGASVGGLRGLGERGL